MTSQEIRSSFIAFFRKKQHQVVPSAPMVVKNDPTLMFINAGMNQFKDVFLGNSKPVAPRVTDSQKCLRVSGKHNDLDEVGHDTYHHTMFEMLGNWSFGDYFKEEAIEWAWEFLHTEMGIPADRMYATVFGGDEGDKQPKDMEAFGFWKKWLPEARILDGNKKDNFWEMGETGPCGPCSEIHIDLRDDEEREKISGAELVNQDHPLVIEVWNLVFIQFNRNADSSLTPLPQKHVDTGMGFERLCMALQGKKSNYDTDVFQPIIAEISRLSALPYGNDEQKDIAMRVIADHLRAIAFAIADGQLPSNVKAGYVIRRILRRAVRYGYTFLDFKTPFINKLVPILVKEMGEFFPELVKQQSLIEKVIAEEEQSFLRTLEQGINRLNQIMSDVKSQGYKMVKGSEAFELYDTFGFPFDLTELILRENELLVSKREFDEEMTKQKERSRSAAAQEAGDWVKVNEDDNSEVFVGYDQTEGDLFITRYREVKTKKETIFQLVFNYTPFYAESGGQAGDSGVLEFDGEVVEITDTKKENNLFIHLTSTLPTNPAALFHAKVDTTRRLAIENNHTSTHLLHHALREILGEHVEQKGSLVEDGKLRFDFSHFQRLSDEELQAVERLVNRKIRENINLDERRNLPIIEAEKMGAMALFGEKYGDVVRVIRFGESIELCGGTHAKATGQIGLFKIVSESAIAAGVRRIEAISADAAEQFVEDKMAILKAVSASFKNSKDVLKSIQKLQEESAQLQKEVATLKLAKAAGMKNEIKHSAKLINGINVIAVAPDLDAASVKDIAFQLRNEVENLFFIAGTVANGKPMLTIAVADNLVADRAVHAGTIIRTLAKEIKGGGGGQPHFATAGGKDPEGVQNALNKAVELIESLAL